VTTIEAHIEDRIASNTVANDGDAGSETVNFWQKLDTKSRISLVLNAISVIVALGMVIMLLLISQSVRDLMNLEARLSGLSQFENRLSARIETGESALHGRLDDLGTQLTNITSQAATLQTRLEMLADQSGQMAGQINRLERATETAGIVPQAVQNPDENRVVRYAPNAASQDSGSVAQAPKLDTARFQRTVTADGKVIYRRIN
jgi:hypothetical protein